jgi:hypothetical protein
MNPGLHQGFMNGDESKLHGILLKYKIKFRSTDHFFGGELQRRYAGGVPRVGFAARCGPQEMGDPVQGKSD